MILGIIMLLISVLISVLIFLIVFVIVTTTQRHSKNNSIIRILERDFKEIGRPNKYRVPDLLKELNYDYKRFNKLLLKAEEKANVKKSKQANAETFAEEISKLYNDKS